MRSVFVKYYLCLILNKIIYDRIMYDERTILTDPRDLHKEDPRDLHKEDPARIRIQIWAQHKRIFRDLDIKDYNKLGV